MSPNPYETDPSPLKERELPKPPPPKQTPPPKEIPLPPVIQYPKPK